jgi:hypothetical protein
VAVHEHVASKKKKSTEQSGQAGGQEFLSARGWIKDSHIQYFEKFPTCSDRS